MTAEFVQWWEAAVLRALLIDAPGYNVAHLEWLVDVREWVESW